MEKQVEILTNTTQTQRKIPYLNLIFLTRSKKGLTCDLTLFFFAGEPNPTRLTRDLIFLLKIISVKKKKNLIYGWSTCLFCALQCITQNSIDKYNAWDYYSFFFFLIKRTSFCYFFLDNEVIYRHVWEVFISVKNVKVKYINKIDINYVYFGLYFNSS